MMLLLALFIAVVIAAIVYPFFSRPYRRASKGLDLIGHSSLRPVDKLALLSVWRHPTASREQYDWLVRTIAELEDHGSEVRQ